MIEYSVKVYDDQTLWFLNGQLHREDGPAVEETDGTKKWFLNGCPHREDGPAREWASGTKSWWINGKRHREDGPAIEYGSGGKEWWLDGEPLSEAQFNAQMNPVKQLTVSEIENLLGHKVEVIAEETK